MQPHEIKPDTRLCTILGYNAQTGHSRRYFNKIMKHYGVNATAIALNVTDEHFDFTMQSVGNSKVDKMIIEREFAKSSIEYCDRLNDDAKKEGRVDFIEVESSKVHGYCLDSEVEGLFDDMSFIDDQTLFVAKMILIAHRWYKTPIEIDIIPTLIQ